VKPLRSKPMDPSREEAMASPLSTFAGWHLHIHCGTCRVLRPRAINDLCRKLDPATRLSSVIDRLRCKACGQPTGWVRLASHEHGTSQGPVRSVLLVGG
jgi:hypothetical protein